jgi:hypothetical protein
MTARPHCACTIMAVKVSRQDHSVPSDGQLVRLPRKVAANTPAACKVPHHLFRWKLTTICG